MIWSRRAVRDLDRIFRFLHDKNPDAAARAIETIRRNLALLDQRPQIGRPATRPTDREWSIRFGDAGYVVRYRMEHETVTVIGLRHMRERGFGDE